MRKLFSGVMAAAVLATGMVTFTPPPAEAQGFRDARAVERFCARNPRARECREFRRDERRDDRRYHNRRGGRPDVRPGRVSRASVARCAQRYRSYDPRTHTYVVNSRGDRAVCRL